MVIMDTWTENLMEWKYFGMILGILILPLNARKFCNTRKNDSKVSTNRFEILSLQ